MLIEPAFVDFLEVAILSRYNDVPSLQCDAVSLIITASPFISSVPESHRRSLLLESVSLYWNGITLRPAQSSPSQVHSTDRRRQTTVTSDQA